jgi:E3 ubiquitin-protein ligase RNF14
MELDDGHPDKLALQRRFGKALLERLVAKFQEDAENKKWLESMTKKCPNCLVSVEKSMGCNHVRAI